MACNLSGNDYLGAVSGAITFDTLAYSRTLQEGGFTETQADVLTKAQKSAFNEMLTNRDLATKGEIARLDVVLKTEVGQLDLALKTEVARLDASIKTEVARLEKQSAEMEARLTKAMHNAMFGMTGAGAAMVVVAVAILK